MKFTYIVEAKNYVFYFLQKQQTEFHHPDRKSDEEKKDVLESLTEFWSTVRNKVEFAENCETQIHHMLWHKNGKLGP